MGLIIRSLFITAVCFSFGVRLYAQDLMSNKYRVVSFVVYGEEQDTIQEMSYSIELSNVVTTNESTNFNLLLSGAVSEYYSCIQLLENIEGVNFEVEYLQEDSTLKIIRGVDLDNVDYGPIDFRWRSCFHTNPYSYLSDEFNFNFFYLNVLLGIHELGTDLQSTMYRDVILDYLPYEIDIKNGIYKYELDVDGIDTYCDKIYACVDNNRLNDIDKAVERAGERYEDLDDRAKSLTTKEGYVNSIERYEIEQYERSLDMDESLYNRCLDGQPDIFFTINVDSLNTNIVRDIPYYPDIGSGKVKKYTQHITIVDLN